MQSGYRRRNLVPAGTPTSYRQRRRPWRPTCGGVRPRGGSQSRTPPGRPSPPVELTDSQGTTSRFALALSTLCLAQRIAQFYGGNPESCAPNSPPTWRPGGEPRSALLVQRACTPRQSASPARKPRGREPIPTMPSPEAPKKMSIAESRHAGSGPCRKPIAGVLAELPDEGEDDTHGRPPRAPPRASGGSGAQGLTRAHPTTRPPIACWRTRSSSRPPAGRLDP